ncbi:tRNA (adenine(22)-N(1))-methyltransferase [Ammoniphilus resinae]|uniref:tRNA (Adenine22-N1)-methyltransferase n=1 Tax=Ammoniphilus resinae TaxID=861532 RepID=A0ABS4GJV2_9BACL|nr:tRNA (adenine(22)-N(1))-methyltransferase TrmK [Ammoniphilus resinae]MBP1930545.1 tRNA (adenine22-N1)-methyltransferase [Ammoniphilus resinae]
MLIISERLKTIADYVKEGSIVADIGSDHAFLPTFLVQTGKVVRAIAGEVNEGPWKSAQNQVKAAGLSDKIDVRLGNGLAVLQDHDQVDTICIAGMGGTLISSILEEGKQSLQDVGHLILQPNVAEKNVREWLYHNGWELKDETILEEDGIIYEILYAECGQPNSPYQQGLWTLEQWFEIGPFLWKQGSEVLREKWMNEKQKATHVLRNLERAKSEEAVTKREEINKRIKWIEEVIRCMPTGKP